MSNKKKLAVAFVAMIAAVCLCCGGAMAYYTDIVSVHAGIYSAKLAGTVSDTTMTGTPQSASVWRESSTTVKDGNATLYSALSSDLNGVTATKADSKTYTVSRGNTLAVNANGGINPNHTFKVTFENTGNKPERFYPEIRLTATDGKSLAQYKGILGVAEASAAATKSGTVSYQNVISGFAADTLTADTYDIPSIVTKTVASKDGTISLYLSSFILEPGESVEKAYVLTENLTGNTDYTVPTVYVTANATIRYAYAKDGSTAWYGAVENKPTPKSAKYTLAPDFQTRVLWKTTDGTFAVRGGPDTIQVVDGSSAKTAEALDYTVMKFTYDGSNHAPTATLLGNNAPYTLYKKTTLGTWSKVADGQSVSLGSYKAVVNESEVAGYAVSHTEFYFDVVKAQEPVNFENRPNDDGSVDTANKLVWNGPEGEKVYDGNPISILGKDSHDNEVPELIFTNKETGEVVDIPTEVGEYIVTPKDTENIDYVGEGLIRITPAPLLIQANDVTVATSEAPTFTSNKTGFVNGETVAVLNGSEVFTVRQGENPISADENGCYPSGTYPIIPSGFSSKNYAITYVAGTLTVKDPTFHVETSSVSRDYNGKELQPGEYVLQITGDTTSLPAGYELVWYDVSETKLTSAPKNVGNYTGRVEKTDPTAPNWTITGNTSLTATITPAQITGRIRYGNISGLDGYYSAPPSMNIEQVYHFYQVDLTNVPQNERQAIYEGVKMTGFGCEGPYEVVSGSNADEDIWEKLDKTTHDRYFYDARVGVPNQSGNEKEDLHIVYYDENGNLGAYEGRGYEGGYRFFRDAMANAATLNASVELGNYYFSTAKTDQLYTGGVIGLDPNAGDDEVQMPYRDSVSVYRKEGINATNCTFVDEDVLARDGYTFKGYAYDKNATEPDFVVGDHAPHVERRNDPDTTPGLILYAVWEENAKPILRTHPTPYDRDTADFMANRATITSITFMNKATDAAPGTEIGNAEQGPWDVSQAQDGTVTAWQIGNDVYIAGNGTGKVYMPQYAASWFSGMSSLITVNGGNLVDTRLATSMYAMFENCTSLESVDVSTWDVSNVTTMGLMFYNCSHLTTVPVDNWQTGNATSMEAMFDFCNALETVNVSAWDVSKVTNMGAMFGACRHLQAVDVSNWQTGNVTNMNSLFTQCEALTSVDVSQWDVSSATSMSYMFHDCERLETIDVSAWETSSVTEMDYMFDFCRSLQTVDVGRWNVSNVTTMVQMFANCTSLETLNLTDWDVSNVSDMSRIFSGCTALTTIGEVDWYSLV